MTLILTFLSTSDGKKSVKEKTNVMNKTTTTCEEGEDTNASNVTKAMHFLKTSGFMSESNMKVR